MNQTNHFFNLGYGWLCKHCSAEDAERRQHELHHHTRFFGKTTNEGTRAVGPPLARWSDADGAALNCPRCGVEEKVTKRFTL